MTTIKNASKQDLVSYIEELTSVYLIDEDYEELKAKAEYCGQMSVKWFGESLTFAEWL